MTSEMNEDSGEYLLKWHEHHTSFFSELLKLDSNLTDVSLITADEHELRAHKLVLATCSPIFSRIFNNETCNKMGNANTVVFVRDVDSSTLKLLLQYVYQGEINVDSCQLESLIQAAKSLKICGLANENSQNQCKNACFDQNVKHFHNDEHSTLTKETNNNNVMHSNESNNGRKEDNEENMKNFDIPMEERGFIGKRSFSRSKSVDKSQFKRQNVKGKEERTQNNGEEEEEERNNTTFNGERVSSGPINTPNLLCSKRHSCPKCEKRFPTPSKLQRHILTHTGEKPFVCEFCQKKFTQLAHLKCHQRFAHSSETNSNGNAEFANFGSHHLRNFVHAFNNAKESY